MTLQITKHSETFSSSPQISPDDIKEIKSLGFRAIINARPDQEGGNNQPTNEDIKAAAEKAGLMYIHTPVAPSNIGTDDIQACAQFLNSAPTPILGFCKTGMRANNLYQSAQKLNAGHSMASQSWLSQKVSYFFKNKCLLTKLYRKLHKSNA
jgi:uncharacterized protein (TIGR01244 family)